MNLPDKVKQLPDTPGVYLMKDSMGNIIYVGKSIHLKRRVQSYFQQSKDHPQKVKMMVRNIRDLDYICTDTEFEAFMLECRLIKELQPAYNRKMKSPQAYAYIEVQTDRHGLRQLAVSMLPDTGNNPLVFGPYSKRHALEKALASWKNTYRLNCSPSSSRSQHCLNYSLGLCLGMCAGGEALEEYNRILEQFISLLQGTDTRILEDMHRRMAEAAADYDFEAAAKYRDSINSVEFLLHKEAVIGLTEQNLSIAIVERLPDSRLKLILVKRNKIIYSEMFHEGGRSSERLAAELQARIIHYFAAEAGLPSQRVTKHDMDEAQILYTYLRSSRCSYTVIPDLWLGIDDEGACEISEAVLQLLAVKPVQDAEDEVAVAEAESGFIAKEE